MRIPRTGLALLCAAAIAGCHRKEQPAPESVAVVAPQARTTKSNPFFAKSEAWYTSFPQPEGQLEDEPAPIGDSIPRTRAQLDPASAMSALIAANEGFAPASGVELTQAMQSLGGYAQLPISFSSVALDSSLILPRLIYAVRGRAVESDSPSKLDFNGRLFLAANLTEDRPGCTPRLKTIEFISWNTRRMKFDFGVIEICNGDAQLKLLDGVRCFTCHKNHGPILGVKPWSNSVHNEVVIEAAKVRRTQRPPDEIELYFADRLPVTGSDADAVDESVRRAADRMLERSLIRALAQSPPGRAALSRLLASVALPGIITTIDARTAKLLNEADMGRFLYEATVLRKTTPTSALHDIDPEALMGKQMKSRGWGSISPADVLKYDDVRAAGDHRLGEKHLPSSPKAFESRVLRPIRRASELMTGAMVARAAGLVEADRAFLSLTLRDAAVSASRRRTWMLTEQDLAERIFTGPIFADVVNSGAIPDRDDFKKLFVSALGEALRFHGESGMYWLSRERYAGSPVLRNDSDFETLAPSPTTACLGCHDIAKPGIKLAFNAIPPLAFDPFNAAERQNWVRANGGRGKVVLSRMLMRMGKDRDMPPIDSAEHTMFREKNPEMFRAAAEFLEKELGRK